MLELSQEDMTEVRGKDIGMIFQEPMTLNPVFTIGQQLSESIMVHSNISKKEAMEAAIEKLNMVSFLHLISDSPIPHELSGYEARVMIAMAMCCNLNC